MKDTILILNRLKLVGVSKFDPGYLETKEYLDAWIESGEYAHHKYYFTRYGRKAELILNNRKDVEPTFHLFAQDET